MKKYCLLSPFLMWATMAFTQPKRLYIAIDDHTDYMWTADETKYDSAFVHMLDYYLRKMDSTRHLPSDQQARFNTDGSIWLSAYEKHRSPERFRKLVAAIRSGHISSPLNMVVSCYGAQPAEAVIRGMYPAGSLQRRYGLQFTMAGSMENNTLPLGLAALWAGSGARYSWKGIGGYGSQMSYEMRARRKYPMYRYTGADGSGVLMKWYAYNEKTIAPLGGYAECRLQIKYKDLKTDLAQVVNTLHRYSDSIQLSVAGAFGFGHDDLQTLEIEPFIGAVKEGTNNQRTVRLSNEEDFFIDFEKTYPVIPAQSVSFGNEWDLLCASMNETTAKVRRAVEKLRTAEALASIASLRNPHFMKGLQTMRDRAWESLGLYWEHNWTADGPVSRKARAEWQVRLQENLSAYVDTLQHLGLKSLGAAIRKNEQPSFYVFNPLSWVRTGVADIPLSEAGPVKVIDQSTGAEAKSQRVIVHGKPYLRILAERLPSMGYKVYEVRKGTPAKVAVAAKFENGDFSNRFYRLHLSRSGAITSLIDSIHGRRQLVKLLDGRAVNDLGATDKEDGDEVVIENSGPVSVTLKAVSKNPLLHTVRVTLYAHTSRIDMEDSIQANFGDIKTWSFSFNLHKPSTRHEELGAILTAKKENRGGDYAAQNARYDWQTFNHFADLSERDYGITVSNRDCSFFKLGKSTVDSLWEVAGQIHALAGGNVDKKVEDGGTLGILNQNGNKDFLYHFSLLPHGTAFRPIDAMKFSLEHQNPLATAWVTGAAKSSTANSYSLLQTGHPNVVCWSVKPAEEGISKGWITRFWNVSAIPVQASIRFKGLLSGSWKTTHLEVDEQAVKTTGNKLRIGFKKFQINTYRCFLQQH